MTQGIGPTADPVRLDQLRAEVAAAPHDLYARHNMAVELRKADRSEEGLAQIEAAWAGGLRAGETALMRGNLLADLGRFDEAVEAYREAARIKPKLLDSHIVLANLLPQIGSPDPPLASFEEALRRAPGHGPLWVQAFASARASGDFAQLLGWTEAGLRRWGPDSMIRSYRAIALSALDRDAEALAAIDAVCAADPGFTMSHVTRAHILLKRGDPARAAEAALVAVRAEPAQQAAWALLSVAWRLLDDPREHWLCDYERLVMPLDVALDPALGPAIEARHVTAAHPPDQSLRGGTQTRGNLFETRDPVILATAGRLRDAIEARLRELPRDDRAHPFLARNTGRVAFPTSWSVRLRSAGNHVSHMHPAGWMSSAFYISLPEEMADGTGRGCLTFGVPDAALGLDLPPRRVVQPREGRLVLFPSYLWHGTTPFESERARLTIAFDMLPVDNPPPEG